MTETTTIQDQCQALRQQLSQHILGQSHLVDRLLIALLADGHLLVEGAPGLAKTKAIKTLADGIDGSFHRIQFTPDLLPGDITGTDVYRPQTGDFTFQAGPLFHNIVLADEINRAPAKVQSALLEAMAERQTTVGSTTHHLPELFLVMATQNPIEQEGTYPLPEAQLDRFLMYVRVDYPSADVERDILRLVREESQHKAQLNTLLDQAAIQQARQAVMDCHMSEAVETYIVQLIVTSRDPSRYDVVNQDWVRFGASPRGTIALDRCARAHAWLQGRDFVTPEDVKAIAHDVLRHRILLSYEAQADGVTPDQFIDALLNTVPAP